MVDGCSTTWSDGIRVEQLGDAARAPRATCSPTRSMPVRRPDPSSSASACASLRTDGESGPNAAQSRYPGSPSNDARNESRSVTPSHSGTPRRRGGRRRRPRSAAEAAIARRVVADRAQEVDLAQVGSERLDEVELAVRALPQQEVAQPLLARGADHEVGIGLAAGVEVLADLLGGEARGELLERAALLVVLRR